MPSRRDHGPGRAGDLWLHSTWLILPMTIFSAIILALVFTYRVEPHATPLDLYRAQATESGVLYVNFSATRLVFIASWSSSVAAVLVGSALVLTSYPGARRILQASETNATGSLPTPYQFALTLSFLSGGGTQAFWDWLTYLVKWKKTRLSQGHMLGVVSTTWAAMTLLSVLVFLADTWLHVATTSTALDLTTPMASMPQYSFGLLENCTWGNASRSATAAFYDCAASIAATNIFFTNPSQTYKVLGNLSTEMTAATATFEDRQPFVYLGVPPSETAAKTDYRATTHALQTSCTPISQECNLVVTSGASTNFWCTPVFWGNVVTDQWQVFYFTDATMEDNDTQTDEGVDNPFYFGRAALLSSGGGGDLYDNDSPQLVRTMHGGEAIVLGCNVTVFDIEYISVNGSVVHWVSQMSNASVTNIVQSMMSRQNPNRADPYLQYHASIAMFSDSVQGLADYMALTYSKAALSFLAGVMEPQAALHAERRESMLVARVPIAPLLALIIANLLFVVSGIVLLAYALIGSDRATKSIQSRLSIAGLVAHSFEGKRDQRAVRKTRELFEEHDGRGSARIGIRQSAEGGHAYTTFGNSSGFEPAVEMHRLLPKQSSADTSERRLVS